MDHGVHHLLDETSKPTAVRMVYKGAAFHQVLQRIRALEHSLHSSCTRRIRKFSDMASGETREAYVEETPEDRYWNQAVHHGVVTIGARLEKMAYKDMTEKGRLGHHTSR